jgi:hypothetical protein
MSYSYTRDDVFDHINYLKVALEKNYNQTVFTCTTNTTTFLKTENSNAVIGPTKADFKWFSIMICFAGIADPESKCFTVFSNNSEMKLEIENMQEVAAIEHMVKTVRQEHKFITRMGFKYVLPRG